MPFSFNPLLGVGLDKSIPLDGAGKIPSTFLPSYVDDVEEYNNLAAFPATGETGKIYVAIDTGFFYRWSGSIYVQIGVTAAAGSTTQVQFNDGGAFGGDAGLVFNKTTDALTIAGPVVHPLASASAPSLTFTGDLNTGIYSPGADQLAISTGGTERARITSAGLVGVGTSGPVAKLHITDLTASAVELLRLQVNLGSPSGNKSITWADATNVVGRISVDYTSPTAKMRFGSLYNSGYQTSDLMTLTPTGLGIGTTAPLTPLAVSGGITGGNAVTPNADIAFPSAANNGYLRLIGGYQVGTGTGGTIQLGGRSYSDSGNVGAFLISANTNAGFNTTDLTVSTQTSFNNVVSEKLRIDQFGRVGIGTTSPSAALSVVGASGTTLVSTITSQVSSGAYVGFFDTTTTDRPMVGAVGNDFAFRTNSVERARIDSSGRLLIGTSSDSGGALLQVNGDRVRVGTAKTPASATATGTTGEICWDASYIYVCTATNTWKRTAIATW